DTEIEALLDEVHGASRAKELDLDVGVPLQVVADNGAEKGEVDRSGYAQEPPRDRLQVGYGALRVLDLADDPRTVVVVSPPGSRAAPLAGRPLEQTRAEPLLEIRHLPADGGLGHPELRRGRREAASLNNPREYEDFVQIHVSLFHR